MEKTLVKKFFEAQDRDYREEARELFSYIKSSLEDEDFKYNYDDAINNADDEPFEYLCVKYGEDAGEDWYVGSGDEAIVDTCQDIRDLLRLAKSPLNESVNPLIATLKNYVIGHTYWELDEVAEKIAEDTDDDIQLDYNVVTKDGSEITGLVIDTTTTLHYDNGQPLTNEYWNYFEHYDRDQDLYDWGADDTIVDVIEQDGEPKYVIDYTDQEIKDNVAAAYDGADWKHDFGSKTPEEVIAACSK